MKIAITLATLLSFLTIKISYSQNGTYKCNHEMFINNDNPSQNKEHFENTIVIVEIYSTGGYVSVSHINDPNPVIYKWNIKNKIDTYVDKEKLIQYTLYEAKWDMGNIEIEGVSMVITLIEELIEKKISVSCSAKNSPTTNFYLDLKKL